MFNVSEVIEVFVDSVVDKIGTVNVFSDHKPTLSQRLSQVNLEGIY